jgi:hypothetical protein
MYSGHKLHLGCGTVYLKDYINVDIQGVPANSYPAIKKHNETTLDKYFKYPYRQNIDNECYDIMADVRDLSLFRTDSMTEIVTVNLVEQMLKKDMLKAAEEHWHRVLEPGGKLVIATPDIKKLCEQMAGVYDSEETEKILTWLYCHARNEFDITHWGYTPDYLTWLLKPIGFEFIKRDDDLINYDAGYPHFVNIYKAVK